MLLEKVTDSVAWFFRITLAKIRSFSWPFQHPCPISGLFRTCGNPGLNRFVTKPVYKPPKRQCGRLLHTPLQTGRRDAVKQTLRRSIRYFNCCRCTYEHRRTWLAHRCELRSSQAFHKFRGPTCSAVISRWRLVTLRRTDSLYMRRNERIHRSHAETAMYTTDGRTDRSNQQVVVTPSSPIRAHNKLYSPASPPLILFNSSIRVPKKIPSSVCE